MIVLAVISYNGAPADPVEASFDELGGTIGRADGNLMVLPDPERTISRVHAKVVFRNGRYALEDRGSNPVTVNGNVVGHGKEWPLSPGDVIQIGGYEVAVRAGEAPRQSADPFADVFSLDAPVPPPAQVPAPSPAPPKAAARSAASQAAHIPSDWNPLADDLSTGGSFGQALGAEKDPGPLAPVAADESIDDLFGLGDKAKPAAAWPEDDDDLLDIFNPASASGGVGEPVVKPKVEDRRIDHMRSELDAAFPGAVTSAPKPAPRPPELSSRAPELQSRSLVTNGRGQGEPPRGAVVSWDGGSRQATIVAPAAAARRTGAMATGTGVSRPGARQAGSAPPAAAAPGNDDLLRAFLEGLGPVQTPAVTALTPDLMRLLGTLLAEAVGGAVDLLQARASIKREVRAEVTAIRPRQNNPLKFSPTAALALQHLLGPQVPGFLRADEAMRDAFRDLRAHELAVMAGMRSALAGLLARFDPKTLESKIAARSGLGALLSGGRRAQLWDSYQQLYAQLSAEAEDDFHEVFGKAFVQAYQEQLDRLSADDGRGGQ